MRKETADITAADTPVLLARGQQGGYWAQLPNTTYDVQMGGWDTLEGGLIPPQHPSSLCCAHLIPDCDVSSQDAFIAPLQTLTRQDEFGLL